MFLLEFVCAAVNDCRRGDFGRFDYFTNANLNDLFKSTYCVFLFCRDVCQNGKYS